MRWLRTFLAFLGFRRASRPEDIPRKLDPETLARAMDEARKLTAMHKVDVKSAPAGELPIPRRADESES